MSQKKELVTPAMINELCTRFAGPSASISDLRLVAICVTAYADFLRFKLAALRYCDVNFAIVKSKTDQYRNGSRVMLAKTGFISCPFYLLQRYIGCAGMGQTEN